MMPAALRTSLSAVVVPLALAVVLLLPTTSWAALNAYLKLPDCAGTVAIGTLTGLIPLNGFTSKFANSASLSTGGGVGAGRVQPSPIQVLTDLDNCPPQVFLDVVTGRHLAAVTILFTRTTSEGNEQPFFRIALTTVVLSAVETTTVAMTGTGDLRNIQAAAAPELNTGDPTAIQEIVTLTFGKIELTDHATNTTMTFNFAGNRAN